MLNSLKRRPWATRVGLVALVSAVGGVFAALGFGADVVDPWTAAAVGLVAILADLGIVRDGETETTPIDDPVGRDGLPLMPYRQLEELREALDAGDLDSARELVGPAPHI